jgi:hypothetical protein
MPETLRKRVLARTRRIGLLGWAISLSALPAFAWAESLPASVRSCATETDPGRRLACYDREIARFPESSPPTATKREPPADKSPTGNAHRDSNSDVAATSAGNDRPGPGVEQKATKQDSGEKQPRHHLSARVVSIEHSPNEMVVHLDNGQVWQQIQAASGDLSLQAGDTVTIDKQLGTYWLSGLHGLTIKVRQKK